MGSAWLHMPLINLSETSRGRRKQPARSVSFFLCSRFLPGRSKSLARRNFSKQKTAARECIASCWNPTGESETEIDFSPVYTGVRPRSPSPATGAGKGKDPARQQPGAQQAHLSGYATYQASGIQSIKISAFVGTNPADKPITSGLPVIRPQSGIEPARISRTSSTLNRPANFEIERLASGWIELLGDSDPFSSAFCNY